MAVGIVLTMAATTDYTEYSSQVQMFGFCKPLNTVRHPHQWSEWWNILVMEWTPNWKTGTSLGYMLKDSAVRSGNAFELLFSTCTNPCTQALKAVSFGLSKSRRMSSVSVKPEYYCSNNSLWSILFAGDRPEFTKRNLGWWGKEKRDLVVDRWPVSAVTRARPRMLHSHNLAMCWLNHLWTGREAQKQAVLVLVE